MYDKSIGVALYCDGGARPNPGAIGYGVHGYVYKAKEDKTYEQINGWYITDRGYQKVINDKFKPVEVLEYFDLVGSSKTPGTNNLAEISALYSGLTNILPKLPGTIRVYTDSEYLRKGIFEWCKGWSKNEWTRQDGTPVINREHWKRLYSLITEYRDQGGEYSMDWVKSHSDIMGNVQADYLAIIGVNYSQRGIEIEDFKFKEAKKYWKPEIETHPFFNFKRIYFNSEERYNIIGNYFQGDSGGGDNVIGKRIPETGFAIIQLKEPDTIIELVKKAQYRLSNDINAVIMLKLDRVFSKEVYPYICSHGDLALIGSKGNINVNFLDNKPVTVEINPTGLSLRAIESFNFLEDILEQFKTFRQTGFDSPSNNLQMHCHDITLEFYQIEQKTVKKEIVLKKVLKPELGVGIRDLQIKITEPHENEEKEITVPIILGLDCLPRNNLKRLETDNPSIFLISWRESKDSMRYATVVECSTGIGIWSNFFSDRIFF